MSVGLVARCPAKVNLGLRVLGRREDGYHELDTVFQAIDLCDTLEARPAPEGELSLVCDDPALPTDGRNLVLRAAHRLRDEAGRPALGARLRLAKRIPVGGGLGGGSSNAAGALLLLSRLWKLDPAPGDLHRMAAEIGSDVPFFLIGGSARGTGRGERLEPLAFPGSSALLLGKPPFAISTAGVYGRLAVRLTLPENDVSLTRLFSHKSWREKDLGFAVNDLERVVFDEFPVLREFRDGLLQEGARCSLLCGSGSTVFGLFDDAPRAAAAGEALSHRFGPWTLTLSRTVGHGVRLG